MASLNQWTKETGINAYIHTADKHSGNSCFQVCSNGSTNYKGITRGNSQQATAYVWAKSPSVGGHIIGHLSYGNLGISANLSGWKRLRATFWYDSDNNTRFGKIEHWDGSVWTQWGADTNFGSGSPALNPIRLGCHAYSQAWLYDDIEVYKKAI